MTRSPYTRNTPIESVMDDPVFGGSGRLILPVEDWYYDGSTLGSLSLTWYNYIDPDKTVELANFLHDHAAAGETIFFDIYSDAERRRTLRSVTPACSSSGAGPERRPPS